MGDYKLISDIESGLQCLECGGEIYSPGRKDRKFCCDACKNKYNNRRINVSRSMKLRIRTMIDKNYIILSSLVKDKIDSVSLDELGMMGFNPEFVTFCKREKGKEYCSCYDIGYEMTSSNLINIRRLDPSDWKLFLPAVKGL